MNFKQQSVQGVNGVKGWNGKLMAHVVAWFGEYVLIDGKQVQKAHRVSRYMSSDPTVAATQVSLMKQMGFDGICLTVQGPTINPVLQEATIALWEQCLIQGMLFCFVLDQWIAKDQPNPTQAVITALQSESYQMIINSPCYVPEKFILEFDLANSAAVDVATVQAAFPDNEILSWHTGYSWPNPTDNPADPSDVLAILEANNALPTMKVAGVNMYFNNGGVPLPTGAYQPPIPAGVTEPEFEGQRDYAHDVWGTGEATIDIDHQAGNWFFDQLATIPSTVPYIAFVTWNDHDEQSAIEQFASIFFGVRIQSSALALKSK
jgi:hypothetical protein